MLSHMQPMQKRRGDHSSSRASMREKLVEKKKANQEHESNFNAGRVNVQERHLHRTGIRGRKIWCFLAVLYLLALMCIINLIILSIMYSVLQIKTDGMKSLSFFENGMLRWTKKSDLEIVTAYKHEIGGFRDQSLDIESQGKKIILHGGPTTNSPQVHVNSDGSGVFKAKKGFRFEDPYAEKEVITFDGNKVLFLPEYIKGEEIGMNRIISHRIVSDDNNNLTLSASTSMDISGHEGVNMDGKTLKFEANTDVNIISSVSNRMELSAQKVALKPASNSIPSNTKNYKLCVCRTSSKLYAVDSPQNASVTCKTIEKIC
ncbi:beta-sarcoglycan isoform X1 [Nematostella vectensis]|uniref:beta-sarcoglycan isoform X1 n=1 Tax=Nematostella vectensis TaxID=45351 RepID=UPI00207742C8|nr:beta-sarcoglycan isoform X1 [Nematostella vectensis]